MDVPLISSLAAGCYDRPVMRVIAAAKHAGTGCGSGVQIPQWFHSHPSGSLEGRLSSVIGPVF